MSSVNYIINTGGGAYIAGDVQIAAGGKFVGRDNKVEKIPDIDELIALVRSTNFIERKAEIRVYQKLLQEEHYIVITGIAGIGKSSLATELCFRHTDESKIFGYSFRKGQTVIELLRGLAALIAQKINTAFWEKFYES
ncbi:MAG: ATP-binding protein, partial [Caldilineaceae bacterium]|nr:ATP-binding protein [Caldilineaceae bacterium]